MGKGGRKGGANLSGAGQPGWCSALVNNGRPRNARSESLFEVGGAATSVLHLHHLS